MRSLLFLDSWKKKIACPARTSDFLFSFFFLDFPHLPRKARKPAGGEEEQGRLQTFRFEKRTCCVRERERKRNVRASAATGNERWKLDGKTFHQVELNRI